MKWDENEAIIVTGTGKDFKEFEQEEKNMKIGFIGCGGNMASAIIHGIIDHDVFAPSDIYGADISQEAAESARTKYNINIVDSDVDW